MKYLIVGLGNIGDEYDGTRHNIGFDVADVLVIKHGASFALERLALRASFSWKGKKFVVIKPTTYMNLSGKALKYWMDKENVPIENVIVIVDDLALPLGTIRLRTKGSNAGHNGLKDIEAVLGNNLYPRLRFGIGNDFPKGRQIEFVIGKWDKKEIPLLQDKIIKAVEAIESIVTIGFDRTMTIFNKN